MQHRFTFSHTVVADDGGVPTEVEMTVSYDGDPTWMTVAERFTEFLRGCGYVFDSHKDLGLVVAN